MSLFPSLNIIIFKFSQKKMPGVKGRGNFCIKLFFDLFPVEITIVKK
jgi:hypothetical protein